MPSVGIEISRDGNAALTPTPTSPQPPMNKRNNKMRMKSEQRNLLLLHLMPHVDESKLPNNMKAQSGLQPLWEDEDMADPGITGKFLLKDAGLLT